MMSELRQVQKWLNEEPNADPDRQAIAYVCSELQSCREERDDYKRRLDVWNSGENSRCADQYWKELQSLRELSSKLVGHNLPTSYTSDDDEVGECPYCSGWNMHHNEGCEALALEQYLSEVREEC